jgi:hypothetical protein
MTPTARVARFVSRIGHPLVVITTSVGIVVATQLPARTGILILAALLLAVIAPTVFLLVAGVRSGKWQDANVSVREERRRFYPWVIPFSALWLFLVWWIRAPIFVIYGGFVMLVLLIVAAVANSWMKISLHTLFASYFAVIFFRVGVVYGVTATIIAALIFWSRLYLSRHTLIETIAGVGLGGGGGIVAVWWPS